MKKRIYAVAAFLLCLCLISTSAGALVIDYNGGVVRRGSYYNGDLSMMLPSSSWEEDSAVSYKDRDEIYFYGGADVNGFIPGIRLVIYDEPWDMSLGFEEMKISGDWIRVVNQKFDVNDKEVHYDCYFSNGNGRIEMDYLTYFNVGNYGVCLYYFTFGATRSIPDELPMLDEMIASLTIEGSGE